MGRPRKKFYEEDVGMAIQEWMRDLDWQDRNVALELSRKSAQLGGLLYIKIG